VGGDELDGDARTAFPRASLALGGGDRELVLLDGMTDVSPLTLEGSSLRGAHLRLGGLEVHAGVTSYLLHANIFIPAKAEAAAGVSYRARFGDSSLTPVVYAFRADADGGGTSGVMTSLVYALDTERLQLQAELGQGAGQPGGLLRIVRSTGSQRFWLEGRHLPMGFASLGTGRRTAPSPTVDRP
jgi:hypothetical protein